MLYQSTRNTRLRETFTDILLTGLAPDGGLYVPEMYPVIDDETLTAWRGLSYPELATSVIQLFVGDAIPNDDLQQIIEKTYTQTAFGTEAIVPVRPLWGNLHIMELSNGPSLAFKDMAMQLLGNLMDYELDRRGKELVILGASSGDTVSAAEEAMRGKSHIKVVMLTPKEGMSPFQKAQAGSILDKNIFNVSIDGRFDDCQDLVKAVNRDLEFKETYKIGAVNSINWGRIVAQVVYHCRAYFELSQTNKQEIDIVVPSGNFGNVLAAHVAKQMGIPIRRLVVATNENLVLDHFIKTGIYQQTDVHVTSSPSMDISKASNLERFIFDLLGRGDTQLNAAMQEFESTKTVDLSPFQAHIKDQFGFMSESSNHDERAAVIKDVYEKTGTVIDPHTAASVKAAIDYSDDSDVPMVCMETAKPTKFEEAVRDAIGTVPERPDAFKGLENREQRFYDVHATVEAVQQFIKETVA